MLHFARCSLFLAVILMACSTASAQYRFGPPTGSQFRQPPGVGGGKQQPGVNGGQPQSGNPQLQGQPAQDAVRQFLQPGGRPQNGVGAGPNIGKAPVNGNGPVNGAGPGIGNGPANGAGPGNSNGPGVGNGPINGNNPQFNRNSGSGGPNQFRQGPGNAPAPPPQPVIPAARAAILPQGMLLAVLRDGVYALDGELSLMANGQGWQKHLQLPALIEIVSVEEPAPTDGALRERLSLIADQYDQVAQNPDYGIIAGLWGFRTIQVALREYSLPPDVRLGRQVAAGTKVFAASLDRTGAGEAWKAHLRLGELSETLAAQEIDPAERALRLQPILQVFDAIGGDPQFGMVADLPGYRYVQTGLKQLVAALTAIGPAGAAPPDGAPVAPVAPGEPAPAEPAPAGEPAPAAPEAGTDPASPQAEAAPQP